MFKIASLCFCFVILFTYTTCRDCGAQSFGDAFSSDLKQLTPCVCEPLSAEELDSMRRFVQSTADSLRARWSQSNKPAYVDWNFPEIAAFHVNEQWSVKCDPSLAKLPAHRLAMQFVSTELRNRPAPCHKAFAVIYTFDLRDDMEEKNVEGNNGQAENQNPPENRSSSASFSLQKDVDFGPYMADLQRRIRMCWHPPVSSTSSRVACVFRVHTDGSLSDLRTLDRGSVELEKTSRNAIGSAAPFPKLPDGAPPNVDIQFTFFYNYKTHKCKNGDPVYRVSLATPEIFSVCRQNYLRQAVRNPAILRRLIDLRHYGSLPVLLPEASTVANPPSNGR